MHPIQVVFALIVVCIGAYGVLWGITWVARFVNRNAPPAPVPYVTTAPTPAPSSPVVLRTDDSKTPDGRTEPVYSQEQLLTFYKWLRAIGAKREDARRELKAMGLPLSNDLWAKAEPAPDLPSTPIAGRPTVAEFRESGDLAYKPLGDTHHP